MVAIVTIRDKNYINIDLSLQISGVIIKEEITSHSAQAIGVRLHI